MIKYTGKEILNESILRKNYLTDYYQETIRKIRNNVLDKKICISVDDTTDYEGRFVANVVIEVLKKKNTGQIFFTNFEKIRLS